MPNLYKEFSKIYDRYVGRIYRFIFIKVNSQEIAQDLTSETFLRAWESLNKQNNPIKNHQAFLYKIARNLVTDYYREKGKNQFISVENEIIADPHQDIEKKSFLNSDLERVNLALNKLPEDYQNVIIWRYLDELSIPEVAKLLERSEQATRVLLHRALNSLRDKLKEV